MTPTTWHGCPNSGRPAPTAIQRPPSGQAYTRGTSALSDSSGGGTAAPWRSAQRLRQVVHDGPAAPRGDQHDERREFLDALVAGRRGIRRIHVPQRAARP
ncbi:hypothetical protein O1L44_00940 [Streptomyces noursei]|nr:hypothetical protein [Streptomyces noursei]